MENTFDQSSGPSVVTGDSAVRLYQRFVDGVCVSPDAPRITTSESARAFSARDEGLEVLLINAPIREWSYPNIEPIGQAYVASVALMDGHRIRVLDLNAERREPKKVSDEAFDQWLRTKVEECLSRKPDVIGIGGIVTQYRQIKRISNLCKTIHPDVPVVLGGGIASSMPEFMLRHLPIDVVVQHEGDVVFSEVLHRFEQGRDMNGVAGTTYRVQGRDGNGDVINNGPRTSVTGGKQGLDLLPWPLRSAWPVDSIYKFNPVGHVNWGPKWKDGAPDSETPLSLSMIASRGCPYGAVGCDYCFATYLGRDYRLRSPKEVVDEMEYLVKEHGISYIETLDDLTLADYRWGLELCKELRTRRRQSGFEVTWGGTCRTNIIATDIIRAQTEGRPHLLEQAFDVGMLRVAYGVETGSPTILKLIDKSEQTPDKIKLAIAETQRVMGYASCSFMFGSPGETAKTIQETVDLCKDIPHVPEVIFFTTAYPGTSFWNLALEKGLIGKSVTGEVGQADDSIIEQYLINLGEQGDAVRTNFSDLPDDELLRLTYKATEELQAQNLHRHPMQEGGSMMQESITRGASQATL